MGRPREPQAINAGAYLAPGADVLVADQHGVWLGRIINIAVQPPLESVVGVLDPRGNPHREVGQRIICLTSQLRSA